MKEEMNGRMKDPSSMEIELDLMPDQLQYKMTKEQYKMTKDHLTTQTSPNNL